MDFAQLEELSSATGGGVGTPSDEPVSDDDVQEVKFVTSKRIEHELEEESEQSFISSLFSANTMASSVISEEFYKITEKLMSFQLGNVPFISQQRQTSKREAEAAFESLNKNRQRKTWVSSAWDWLYPKLPGTLSLLPRDETDEAKDARYREFQKAQEEKERQPALLGEYVEAIDESGKRIESYKKRQEAAKLRHNEYLKELKKEGKIKEDDINEAYAYLVPKDSISAEQEQLLEEKFATGIKDQVVVERFNAPLTKHCFRTTNYGCWVNDEVVNAFLQMCEARGADRADRPYVFSSFFLTTLVKPKVGYKYAEVQRWTARGKGKADLFARRAVIVPVNINNTHWCLAAIDIKYKSIYYFDSLGGDGTEVKETLLQYLQDEHQAKKNQPLPDKDQWKLISPRKQVPQQSNSNDCGVFTCSFGNTLMEFFLKEDRPVVFNIFRFTAKDMGRIRQQIQLDLLRNAVFPIPSETGFVRGGDDD